MTQKIGKYGHAGEPIALVSHGRPRHRLIPAFRLPPSRVSNGHLRPHPRGLVADIGIMRPKIYVLALIATVAIGGIFLLITASSSTLQGSCAQPGQDEHCLTLFTGEEGSTGNMVVIPEDEWPIDVLPVGGSVTIRSFEQHDLSSFVIATGVSPGDSAQAQVLEGTVFACLVREDSVAWCRSVEVRDDSTVGLNYGF